MSEKGPYRRDPAGAWQRFQNGSGPLHDLTVTVARTIHEQEHQGKKWDADVVSDQWLAVGAWQTAEAVVAALPLVVRP